MTPFTISFSGCNTHVSISLSYPKTAPKTENYRILDTLHMVVLSVAAYYTLLSWLNPSYASHMTKWYVSVHVVPASHDTQIEMQNLGVFR